MDKLLWSVDDQKYNHRDRESLLLGGWAADREGRSLAFSLRKDDGSPVEIPAPIHFERPDVAAQYPELFPAVPDTAGASDKAGMPDTAGTPDTAEVPETAGKPDTEKASDTADTSDTTGTPDTAADAAAPASHRDAPGFTVKIPEIRALASSCEKLSLVLTAGVDSAVIWEKSGSGLLSFCRESMLEYHLDRQEILYKTMVTAEGWCLMQQGTERILVLDEKENPVPAKLTRCRRPDVAESLSLGKEAARQEIGFRISVRRADIPGKKLLLVFEGDTGETAEEVKTARDSAEAGSGASPFGLIRRTCVIDLKKLAADASPMGRRKKVLSWENHRENLDYLRRKGFREFLKYVDARAGILTGDYEQWLSRHRASRRELAIQKRVQFPYTPLLSIAVPLYNTPLPYLRELIRSVKAQSYRRWQLVLADGSQGDEIADFMEKHYASEFRILYHRLEKNGGISENTNQALELAEGAYILFADHDDVLAPDALYEIVHAINGHPHADVLYTDEDKLSMDGRHYFEPNFKPDFNLFRLRENNYICHLFAVKRTLLEDVGGLRREFDGAQDYDLILRCTEQAEEIVHIPRVLYHWRSHMESTAADPASKEYAFQAGQLALEEHYRRVGIHALVELTSRPGWYRSRVEIRDLPLISVIIPNKDHIADLELCLNSIVSKTTWKNYEILIVENNSEMPETFACYQALPEKFPDTDIRVLTWKDSFNFSAINNFAAKEAKGKYLLFLNNDVEVLSPDWMQELLMPAQQPGVGIVGAKLYYPDGTIQHAGVVIGLGGIAGHILCRASGSEAGYMGRLVCVQEVSAVTAACMLVKRPVFDNCRGFDENFAVAFNDIDLCMKARARGEKVVFTPYAELYHYESKSRGPEDSPEKQLRFQKETERFTKKWAKELAKGDPYYSPNLSVTEGDCSLRE